MKKLVAAAAVVVLALAALLFRPARPVEPVVRIDPPPPRPARSAPARPVVYVVGHVVRSGLYTLAPGARVDEAIRAAGGIVRDADPVAVNLAAHVTDGEEIVVPALGEAGPHPRRAHGRRAKGPRRRRRHAVPTGNEDAAGDGASGI